MEVLLHGAEATSNAGPSPAQQETEEKELMIMTAFTMGPNNRNDKKQKGRRKEELRTEND